jgi:hypothetical protein
MDTYDFIADPLLVKFTHVSIGIVTIVLGV